MEKSVEELLRQIKDKMPDFKITAKDLNFPSTEFLINYTIHVLTDLGIETDSITSPPELQNLQYPEVYEEVMPRLRLYFVVRNLIPSFLLEDFSVAAFIDQRHTNYIQWIQTLDNFHTFVVSRNTEMSIDAFINQMRENHKEVEEKRRALDEAKEMLNQRAVERSTRSSRTKQLLESIATRKDYVAAKTAEIEITSKKIDDISVLCTQEELEGEKLGAVELQSETQCKALQAQFVHAPNKLMEEAEALRTRSKELHEELETLKQKRITQKQQIKALEQVEVDMATRIAHISSILDTTKELELTEKKIINADHSVAQHTQTATDAQRRLVDLNQKLKVINDEYEEVKLQATNTELSLQKRLQELEMTHKEKLTLYSEKCQQVAELELKASKLHELQNEYEIESQKTNSEYEIARMGIVEQGRKDIKAATDLVITKLASKIDSM